MIAPLVIAASNRALPDALRAPGMKDCGAIVVAHAAAFRGRAIH